MWTLVVRFRLEKSDVKNMLLKIKGKFRNIFERKTFKKCSKIFSKRQLARVNFIEVNGRILINRILTIIQTLAWHSLWHAFQSIILTHLQSKISRQAIEAKMQTWGVKNGFPSHVIWNWLVIRKNLFLNTCHFGNGHFCYRSFCPDISGTTSHTG